MNRARRKRLQEILDQIEFLQMDVNTVRDEEQDAYDNLPESIQYSERGEQMQEYADHIEEAYQSLQEAIDTLYDIIEG